MHLTIHRRKVGALEMSADLVRSEVRDAVRLLDADSPRNSEIVTMCSWCRSVRTSPEQWAEVEAAIEPLNLFEQIEFPQIAHGICPACLAMIVEGDGVIR